MDPRPHLRTLADEFKTFALKGNVVDLAVGIIIGAAFTQVVTSLVANIIMPLLNAILPTGHTSYTAWSVPVNGSDVPVGKFLGDVANFLLVALVLFLVIRKFLSWVLSLRRSEAAEEVPPLTRQEELLTEIRDLLKKAAEPPPSEPRP